MWSLLLPAATVWYFATYRSGFPILTVTNEKMYYIYEKLVEVVKCNISRNKSHYPWCPALELLCSSLCGLQIKKFGDTCTKQTITRFLFGKTAELMYCDIKAERKFTAGFVTIPWNWAAEIFSKSTNAFKKLYNICRQSYKPSRNLRRNV